MHHASGSTSSSLRAARPLAVGARSGLLGPIAKSLACRQELVQKKCAPRLSRPSPFHSARSPSLWPCRAPALPCRLRGVSGLTLRSSGLAFGKPLSSNVSPSLEESSNVCRSTNAAVSERTKVFAVWAGGFACAWRLPCVAPEECKARRARSQWVGGEQRQQCITRREAHRFHYGPPVRWRSAHVRVCSGQ